jgi:hypothetical protein
MVALCRRSGDLWNDGRKQRSTEKTLSAAQSRIGIGDRQRREGTSRWRPLDRGIILGCRVAVHPAAAVCGADTQNSALLPRHLDAVVEEVLHHRLVSGTMLRCMESKWRGAGCE